MKAVKIIVPILILVIAIIYIVKRAGPPPRPAEVDQRIMRVIDADSLEISDITIGEFANAKQDKATGYRIVAEGRKVAEPISCISCGELIPPAPLPVDIHPEEEERIEANHVCPRCDNKAYIQ